MITLGTAIILCMKSHTLGLNRFHVHDVSDADIQCRYISLKNDH